MLLPITLTAKRGNYQSFMTRKANKAFFGIRDKVLGRDNFTCRFCGFQISQFQEVVNIDHNYRNNKLENLATACSFCTPCFFLDGIGSDGKSGGMIIHLPELSQADLNHFCRALFCSMLRDAPYRGKLQATYLSLQDRGTLVEQAFGPHTHDATIFGQSMIDSNLSPEQMRHKLFTELRLLPSRKYYKEQAEYWKTTVFANIPL